MSSWSATASRSPRRSTTTCSKASPARRSLELLENEGIPTEVRSIDRSELYVADEMFLCGTGVQISPVVEVDHRPVGSGEVGPIARLVRDRYFDAVRGRIPEYSHWLTPIE